MIGFASRHPIWSLIILLAVAVFAWMIFAPWPPGLEEALGRKRIFLNAIFGGVTLGALYFLVASGFTLIFGLMRNVNLAHGSLYLLGGYLGFEISEFTGSWLLAFPIVFIIVALLGVILQHQVFRRMDGEDLRQTMVTIGLSVVLADLMLWYWGGQSYTIFAPDWLSGPATLPVISSIRESGEIVYLRYPLCVLPSWWRPSSSVLACGCSLTARASACSFALVSMTARCSPRQACAFSTFSWQFLLSARVWPGLPASLAAHSNRSVRAKTHASSWHRSS